MVYNVAYRVGSQIFCLFKNMFWNQHHFRFHDPADVCLFVSNFVWLGLRWGERDSIQR